MIKKINQIIPNWMTLALIIGFTIIGTALWLFTLFLLWMVLQLMNVRSDFFVLVESLSTAVAAAAFISAGFIAYKELSEISNSRHLEVINQLFLDLNSPENIEARRWVYLNLKDNPEVEIPQLLPEGRDAIKRVLNSLDHVAFLTQPGLVNESIIMPWMNPMIVKSWEKLCPYVKYERDRRKEPDYYKTAEKLAERCNEWRQKHVTESPINWMDAKTL